MNLSGIWAECGRLLNDPNNQRWGTDVLTTRANAAQIEIQGYTKAVKTVATASMDAGVSGIVINGDTMDIVAATIQGADGSVKPFQIITREELDFRYPDWRQWQNGVPLFWYWEETLTQVILAPAPDAANAISAGLTFWEIRKPTDMVNGPDIPFDSTYSMYPYHMAIVHWVVSYCWMDDGTPEALGKSKFHRSGSMLKPGEYEKQIGRIMAEFDNADLIQTNILWKPEGGRAGGWGFPSKSMPLTF